MRVSIEQRSKINHELKKVGFGGLDDPNIFAQIATLYPNHNSFRGLLMSTAPSQRRIAYESLRPHLSFIAKPLDVYEREVKEKAEREQWDVIDPNNPHFPQAFKVGEVETEGYRLEKLAQETIKQAQHEATGHLELVCTKCTRQEFFRAKRRIDAEKESRAAGWRSDGTRTYCPEHVPGRCSMTLNCTECGNTANIRCWEPEDGYVKARLAGWKIDDSAVCPKCSAPKIILQ